MFCVPSTSNVKLSEDSCTALITNDSNDNWIYIESNLSIDKDVYFHVIKTDQDVNKSLEVVLLTESPSKEKFPLNDQNESMKFMKNYWRIKNNLCEYFAEDNNKTIEEIDLNLSELREDDIIGFKINKKGELWYSYHGRPIDKLSEGLCNITVYCALKLTPSVSMVTLLSHNNPIIAQHLKHYQDCLQHHYLTMSSQYRFSTPTPLEFHSTCGSQIESVDNWTIPGLIGHRTIARRRNPICEFRNAVVVSARALMTNQLFQLKIEGTVNKWNGSIEFGLTQHDPDLTEIPATLTNLRAGTLIMSGNSILTNGHSTQSPYAGKSLDDLKIGDLIGVQRRSNGNIYFFINNINLGLAGNISIEKLLWVIADLYGRTIKVSVVQPEAFLDPEDLSDTDEEVVDRRIRKMPFPNYIPKSLNINKITPLQFHNKTGSNINLLVNNTMADRVTDSEFNNGIVFTNRPIKIGESFFVELTRTLSDWSGNLELGVTNHSPDDFAFPLTMTDISEGHSLIFTNNGIIYNGNSLMTRSIGDPVNVCTHPILNYGLPVLDTDTIIGVQLVSPNLVKFFINSADLGTIHITNDDNADIYGVVDLYGKAATVRLLSSDDAVFKDRSISQLANQIAEITSDLHFLQTDGYWQENCNEKAVFHSHHGRNILLMNDRHSATRLSNTDTSGLNVTVMSSRQLKLNELFEFEIDELGQLWNQGIRLAITSRVPLTSSNRNSDNSISPRLFDDNTNIDYFDKYCYYLKGNELISPDTSVNPNYPLKLSDLSSQSKIGIMHQSNGSIHFYLNGHDQGVAFTKMGVRESFFVLIDFNRQCNKISITNRSSQIFTRDQLKEATLYTDSSLYTCTNVKKLLQSFKKEDENQEVSLDQIISEDTKLMSETRADSDSRSIEIDRYKKLILFDEMLFSRGVKWTASTQLYQAFYSNTNCLIRSKIPLETNSFHQLNFVHLDIELNHSTTSTSPSSSSSLPNSLIFGFVSKPHSISDLSIPANKNDLNLPTPNWLIFNQSLFIDNKLIKSNFALDLLNMKQEIKIGLYFFNNGYLQIIVDDQPVHDVIYGLSNKVYLVCDISGWYNGFSGNTSTSILDLDYNDPQCRFLLSKSRQIQLNQSESITNENSNIPLNNESELKTNQIDFIVNKLYDLLPIYLKYLNEDLESEQVIVALSNPESSTGSSSVHNWDIIKAVQSSLSLEHIMTAETKECIQEILIRELSRRLVRMQKVDAHGIVRALTMETNSSSIPSYSDNPISQFHTARQLELQVRLDSCSFVDDQLIIIPKNSKIKFESENCVIRIKESTNENDEDEKSANHKSGDHLNELTNQNGEERKQSNQNAAFKTSTNQNRENGDYGLVYVQQVLDLTCLYNSSCKSHKIRIESQSQSSSMNQPIKLGLIMIPTNQHLFPVSSIHSNQLKLLSSDLVPSPKQLSLLTNQMNRSLQIQQYELPCLLICFVGNTIYANQYKVCEVAGFSLDRISTNVEELYFEATNENGDCWISLIRSSSSNYEQIQLFRMSEIMNVLGLELYSVLSNQYAFTPLIWINSDQIKVSVMPLSPADVSLNSQNSRTMQPTSETAEKWTLDHQNYRNQSKSRTNQICPQIIEANHIRDNIMVLPHTYFLLPHTSGNHPNSIVCFCTSCLDNRRQQRDIGGAAANCPAVTETDLVIKGDPPCQIRLPIGYVKQPIRLKKELRNTIMKWHLAYLTVSYGYIHELLSVSNPLNKLMSLKCKSTDSNKLQLLWLQNPTCYTDETNGNMEQFDRIIVSPWNPLLGCFLTSENTIETIPDAYIKYKLDERARSSRIALEVRVKPNSYKFAEFKNQTMEFDVEKRQKEARRGADDSTNDMNCKVCMLDDEYKQQAAAAVINTNHSTISQKTVWILNNNSEMVITALLTMSYD